MLFGIPSPPAVALAQWIHNKKNIVHLHLIFRYIKLTLLIVHLGEYHLYILLTLRAHILTYRDVDVSGNIENIKNT